MPTCSPIAPLGYQITDQLYAGSRTLVHRAVREVDQQPVVIKRLRNECPSFNELVQFRNQYTIAKNLDSPGIVKPCSLEPCGSGYALVMNDFGGVSLSTYVREQTNNSNSRGLPLADFLAIALQLCDILHELYQQRVIHKDIKPDNILIHSATKQIKLIDFSIASLLPKETPEIQSPTVLEGTLAYLSPEQTGRMNRGIDYRSDFYSLGVTFYELLTGQLPFLSSDPLELIHCHIAQHPVAVDQINPEIASALSAIVNKLMAKNAEDRYQTTFGLKHDLTRCGEQWQQTGTIEFFDIGQRDICDRFLIPEVLYGRESEVQRLLDAFERVSQGNTEVLLVAGFSGVGKTAVVNEVHKPLAKGTGHATVRQRGYFIKGKFDQFQRNIPLSAFVQAFRDLVGQLLSESDAQLEQWKTSILAALGENAQVIIEVIPELECVIGLQPPAPELSGSAAQNRFDRLFQQFIQVFTTPAHPLVIFIDDLQWADAASLNLMRSLMSETATRYLLFIGAYRDNEVTGAHPLMLSLAEMQQSGATVTTLTLAPLPLGSVNQLVADTLSCSLTLALPLTTLIVEKTGGNPFFTTQFLKALYDDRLLTFNSNENYWECEIVQVRALTLTDDVVTFMATQLQKLPTLTQAVLKLAACMGNQFDLSTLAIVAQQPEAEIAANLWKALQEGLVIPQSTVYKFFSNSLEIDDLWPNSVDNFSVTYRFLHDRVQQAAYSLIPDDQKQATHLKIGHLLRQESSEIQRQERIFEIVGHFNLARGLICDRAAHYELAALNLQAGRTAKASAAFESALMFVNLGIHSLPADSWQEHPTLTLALHNLAAEAAYLCSQFERMEQLVAAILQETTQLLDQVSAYEIQILAYLAQSQPQSAIDVALEVLQQFDIRLPKTPTQLQVLLGLAKTKLVLGNKKPGQLINLPTMTDANALAAMRILSSAASAAYICAPQLMPLLVFERINLSVRYGNTALSSFAYAWYGLILCGIVVDIETGYQFGQLALQLLERLNSTDLRAKTLFTTHTFISHWRDRVADTMPALLTAYQSGLDSGDVEYAAWSALVDSYNRYWTGQPLTESEAAMRSFITTIAPFNQKNASLYLQIYHQATLNLLGESSDPGCLSGESYQVAQEIPAQVLANDRTGLFFSYVCQQHLHYLFGQYAESVEKSNLARPYFDNCISSLPTVLHYFYDSLARLALYETATSSERKQILKCLQTNQKKLKKWAHYAPTNYQHKVLLVEAEQCRILGQKAEAIDRYDQAIALAKQHNYLNEAALANELAARFYLDWGKERLAQDYLIDAYYDYARWGAKAKVKDLEQQYSQLLTAILQPEKPSLSAKAPITSGWVSSHSNHLLSTSSRVLAALDLETILKASQSLSSEIELETLLSTWLAIVLENAGADACTLLLLKADQLFVEATAAIDQPSVVLQALPLAESQTVPISLINTVKHSLKPVVIANTAQHEGLMADPYILRQQPKSVLCTPIVHQGNLLGILYLENNLTLGAFSSDRVKLLNLLCAQAAISLENARLYQESQQSLSALSTISARFQRMTENLPGIVYQFRLTPDGSASTPYMSPASLTLLEVSPEDFMTGTQDFRAMEHPDDRPGIERVAAQSAQTLMPFEHLSRYITPSGTMKWIQSFARPEQQPDGSILWDGLKIDVTARVQAECQLQESQQLLQLVLDTIPHRVFWKDLNRVYQGCNSSFAEVAGVGLPINIVGKSDHDLAWTPETADCFRECDRRVMNSNTPELNVVESQIQVNGIPVWLETSKLPLHDADGKVMGLLGVYQNITDRKHAETQLNQRTAELEQTLQELQHTQMQMVQSEKMSGLGQLVAGVAHEINNPVNFIYGNLNHADNYLQDLLMLLNLYQQHYSTPHADIQRAIEAIDLEFLTEDLQKLLTSMKVGADRIQKIVASLRNFSRMDEAAIKEVDIHEGIESTLMILQHRLRDRVNTPNIEIVRAFGELPLIECYAGQLNQVFMNLLSNAIDALDESLASEKMRRAPGKPALTPTITIHTALLDDQQIAIQISDNGVGVPDSVKQRLFDPFFTTKPVGKGTGMGLSISYQVVTEKHKGTLHCVSALGQGATFIVTIPTRQG